MEKSEIEQKAREGGILTISEVMYWIYGVECSFKRGPYVAEGAPDIVYQPDSVLITDAGICVVTLYGEAEDKIRMPRHMTHKATLDIHKDAKGYKSGSRLVLKITEKMPHHYRTLFASPDKLVEECRHIAAAEPMRKLYLDTLPKLKDGSHELFKRPFPWEITCPEALSVYRTLGIEPPAAIRAEPATA